MSCNGSGAARDRLLLVTRKEKIFMSKYTHAYAPPRLYFGGLLKMHYIPSPARYKQALAGRIRTLCKHVEPCFGVDDPPGSLSSQEHALQ